MGVRFPQGGPKCQTVILILEYVDYKYCGCVVHLFLVYLLINTGKRNGGNLPSYLGQERKNCLDLFAESRYNYCLTEKKMAGYTKEFLVDAFVSRYEVLGAVIAHKQRALAEATYAEFGKDKFRVLTSLDADALKKFKLATGRKS